MRALLLLQLVFGHSRAQSGDGISGNKRVTTSFDIVTETKITYRPDLLDTSTPAYLVEKNRVVDETRPGFEAAAARTGATLISVDVLFSLSSSGFSARRRRQATQTVYTQITPTFSIIEQDPDVPQFELTSVAEAEQEMRETVQAADSTSVFVRDAAITTGTASSTAVDVPLDFPIVDGGTTTTRATTTTVASGNGFPVVDGVTTTTRATTTTRSTTTTTRAGGATAPTDYPIYDGEQATQAPTNEPGNDFPIVDDVTTTTRTTTKTTTKTATTTTTRSDGDFPVVDGATTTTRAPTTTTSGNNFPVVDDTEIIEDNTDNDTVTTTTVRTTTRSTTVTVNPGTIPTGFPIYDDQQLVTVDDEGLFPVIDDTTTTESANNNTTTATERSTTESLPSQSTPTDFPIYDPDQNITDVNTGFPVVPETNSTTTSATNTTTTENTTNTNTTTTEEITNTTTEFSTESVSLGTTAKPNTTTTEEATTTDDTWNSGSRIILSFSLILSSLLFL